MDVNRKIVAIASIRVGSKSVYCNLNIDGDNYIWSCDDKTIETRLNDELRYVFDHEEEFRLGSPERGNKYYQIASAVADRVPRMVVISWNQTEGDVVN